MMNPTSPERVRQDCRLIRQTLLKLALPRLILRLIVIAVAVLIWLYVASVIMDFGKTINYGALQPLGPQTVDLLARINPYLWWGVVAIWSLIVFFLVRGWLNSSMDSARGLTVPADTFADLVPELSDDVVGVLRWCWGSREEPFTIGDLHRALSETRRGRITKIAMVREQETLLAATAEQSPPRGPRGGIRADAERRGDMRVDVRETRDGRSDRPLEPRIGPAR
jgi:hypothetical protein